MKISTFTFLSVVTSASAFSTSSSLNVVSTSKKTTQLNAVEGTEGLSRRNMIFATGSSTLAFLLSNTQAANADVSLLDQFGSDPKKIVQKKEEEIIIPNGKKGDSNLEPNLRSNYYYPTNKKRYLPRIKKCNDAIPAAADAIGNEDWDTASEFVNKIADDTILPLKLYTSSLTGGGTNIKVSFTKDMSNAADGFEKAQKSLVKAVKKKDQTASSRALEDLSSNLQAYREAGKLTGPDAGGDIPR